MAVSMQLEIAPQHHLFMIGQRGMNVKQIMQRTGATIHFPDPNNVTPLRKGTVFITGSIESVYLAREQLIVSLYYHSVLTDIYSLVQECRIIFSYYDLFL